MNFENVPKKTQLISLDSNQRTSGTVDNCIFDLRSHDSKIFLENLTDVIGVRLIDYHVSVLDISNSNGPHVIDIQIDEIPTRGQILDQEFGTLFARIPIDRTLSKQNPMLVFSHDQSTDPSHNKTASRYFNPVSIPKLTIHQTQLSNSSRTREPLQSDCGWYMILEITTLNHEAPKPDRLEKAIEELSRHIREMPPPQIVQPVEKTSGKIPLWKLIVPILMFLGGMFWFFQRKTPAPAPAYGPPDF
jgi:hypothetical protein